MKAVSWYGCSEWSAESAKTPLYTIPIEYIGLTQIKFDWVTQSLKIGWTTSDEGLVASLSLKLFADIPYSSDAMVAQLPEVDSAALQATFSHATLCAISKDLAINKLYIQLQVRIAFLNLL